MNPGSDSEVERRRDQGGGRLDGLRVAWPQSASGFTSGLVRICSAGDGALLIGVPDTQHALRR